jgi:two-component system, response regulator RegA
MIDAPQQDGIPTLLIVDDDDELRRALGEAMGRRGFLVTTAGSATEAEAQARHIVFEYALVDMRMPRTTGIELIPRLLAIDPGTRIVVLTGYGSITTAVDAIKAGAFDYLVKPVDGAMCEEALLGRGRGSRASDPADHPPSLERVEWEYLQRVLADCEGNISEAARRLRMHRRTLQRKMSKHPPPR